MFVNFSKKTYKGTKFILYIQRILIIVYFFLYYRVAFFLTHEKSENNQTYSYPLRYRQLFPEEEEHPKRGEHRSDIIERIRLRHPYLAQRIAEDDKGDHRCEHCQVRYTPKCNLHFGIGNCILDIGY